MPGSDESSGAAGDKDQSWPDAAVPVHGIGHGHHACGVFSSDAERQEGQLAVLIAEEFFVGRARRSGWPAGRRRAERPAERLRRAIEQALADGYAGLRMAAEMSWAASGTRWARQSVQLAEFERAAGQLVRSHPVACLCSYDRRLFGSDRLGSLVALVALHTGLCGGAS